METAYVQNTILTCVGDVTLMSMAAASSNRLIMFSCFNSLDGVTLGGGGTAGLSWLYKQMNQICKTKKKKKKQEKKSAELLRRN